MTSTSNRKPNDSVGCYTIPAPAVPCDMPRSVEMTYCAEADGNEIIVPSCLGTLLK